MRTIYVFRGHTQDPQSPNSNPIPGPILPSIESSSRFVNQITVYYHFPRLCHPQVTGEKNNQARQRARRVHSIV